MKSTAKRTKTTELPNDPCLTTHKPVRLPTDPPAGQLKQRRPLTSGVLEDPVGSAILGIDPTVRRKQSMKWHCGWVQLNRSEGRPRRAPRLESVRRLFLTNVLPEHQPTMSSRLYGKFRSRSSNDWKKMNTITHRSAQPFHRIASMLPRGGTRASSLRNSGGFQPSIIKDQIAKSAPQE